MMWNTLRASALLGLALSAGLAATNKSVVPKAAAKAATPAAARPRQTIIPDVDLEKAIRGRFAASKISTHNFQVHVRGGVATIEGKTDVLQHKGTATRLARSSGAAKVVNNIEVSQAAKDKAAKNLATGRRRAQIKRSDTTKRSEKRSL